MSDLMSGFYGAIIGAVALVASGLLVEIYKHHRDRRAAASAIAGEIFSILEMVAQRRHIQFFTSIKRALEAGEDVAIPNVVGTGLEGKLDPVVEAHLPRLGLLAGNRRPERIAKFYTQLRGIRIDIVNLSRKAFDKSASANLIGEDLAIWSETHKLGNELYAELIRT